MGNKIITFLRWKYLFIWTYVPCFCFREKWSVHWWDFWISMVLRFSSKTCKLPKIDFLLSIVTLDNWTNRQGMSACILSWIPALISFFISCNSCQCELWPFCWNYSWNFYFWLTWAEVMGELIVYQCPCHPLYIVRPLVNIFKHLPWNHWANWTQILYADSLRWGNQSLFRWFWSHDQDGCHTHL